MMKQMQKTVCALAVLATLSLPALAESIDVRVIGTITPSACTPNLSGGGTIDYGAISPESLSADGYTVLAAKQLDFAITCDAPTKVALKAINGRPNSLAGASESGTNGAGKAPDGVTLFSTSGVGVVGLGLDGESKVGGYGIRLAGGTVTADDQPVHTLQSNTNTDNWSISADNLGSLFDGYSKLRFNSWGAEGSKEPVAFEALSGKLEVQAYINKVSELDLTKPVPLDGLTTIELVYL